MSAGSLKFFYDAFSQPCRAVLILMEVEKISYQPCLINIAKGELAEYCISIVSSNSYRRD